jgi:hypothetical protein
MSGTHPAEETLQQYILDRGVCRPEEIDHIGSCPHCQALVAIYGQVISELDRQPAPAFDFDVSAAVMGRVQEAGRQHQLVMSPARERTGSIATIWTVIALVIGVPAWLFRKSAYFVFTDMEPEFYWLLLAITGVVVALFGIRLQRKYQNVINLINK